MFTYMYNTDTRYCLCFCSCSYTYSWQLHFQVSGKWSVASKKNLKFEIFLIINKQIMSILLARTSSRKLKVAKFYVSCWRLKLQLDVLAGIPGIATNMIQYSYFMQGKTLYRQICLLKILYRQIYSLKKQSCVSVNAHLHVYVFSCYFLRFTCVCIVRVVRVVCKWNTKSCNFKVTSYEIFFRDHVQCTTLHYSSSWTGILIKVEVSRKYGVLVLSFWHLSELSSPIPTYVVPACASPGPNLPTMMSWTRSWVCSATPRNPNISPHPSSTFIWCCCGSISSNLSSRIFSASSGMIRFFCFVP